MRGYLQPIVLSDALSSPSFELDRVDGDLFSLSRGLLGPLTIGLENTRRRGARDRVRKGVVGTDDPQATGSGSHAHVDLMIGPVDLFGPRASIPPPIDGQKDDFRPRLG